MTNFRERRTLEWVPKAEEMLEHGATYKDTAVAVDRDPDTVRRHLPGYGRNNPQWHARALEMLKEGHSYREVARTVGIDRKQISKTFPGFGFTPEEAVMVRKANAMLKGLGA